MNNFVEKKKLSKKAQRALNNEKRQTWDFSPVTRTVESKKIYNITRCRDFAPAGATKGLSDRPLETFGPHNKVTSRDPLSEITAYAYLIRFFGRVRE